VLLFEFPEGVWGKNAMEERKFDLEELKIDEKKRPTVAFRILFLR
jgi:hypothetical protein